MVHYPSLFVSACVLGSVSVAGAQQHYSFLAFPNGNIYDGSQPIMVELWIQFDAQFGAVAGWKGKIDGDPFGEWNNLAEHLYGQNLAAVGMSLGTPATGDVNGIILGQLNAQFGGLVLTQNPIKIWSGEWTTSNLAPRIAFFSIDTTQFNVYQPTLLKSQNETSNIDGVGSGIIVVPAPAAGTMLGLSALAFAARRRR